MKAFIVILGGGESGTGAALLAKKKGLDVFLSDSGLIRNPFREKLLEENISFEEKNHSEEIILKATEIIKSPGIPDDAVIVRKARRKKIPVISEIEFAGRYAKGKKICITGSNGKTTTTRLTHHIFTRAGKDAALVGNVGNSFAAAVAERDYDYYIIELSSFQLDGMYDFRADTAILLNITPDHLDRYKNKMRNYVKSKFRITQNMRSKDTFIFCNDDPTIMKQMKRNSLPSKQFPFSIMTKVERGAHLSGNDILLDLKSGGSSKLMTIQSLALQGKHNLYNSMAAGIAARAYDIRNTVIKESLSDFQNIEHRLEYVTNVHGIEFINDSKATNVNSTWYALESMSKPVIWIVGGIDKGNDYSILFDMVKEKVKGIVCLGKSNSKIMKIFSGIVPNITEASNADEAVKRAYDMGSNGDVVLLSPACASFDLFENYEDRGIRFKNAVYEL
ncbi:MAG: UDP-N-acetylmuramoyl-L-alanine--D-glutamate ligase [Bacteroidota bacterium]